MRCRLLHLLHLLHLLQGRGGGETVGMQPRRGWVPNRPRGVRVAGSRTAPALAPTAATRRVTACTLTLAVGRHGVAELQEGGRPWTQGKVQKVEGIEGGGSSKQRGPTTIAQTYAADGGSMRFSNAFWRSISRCTMASMYSACDSLLKSSEGNELAPAGGGGERAADGCSLASASSSRSRCSNIMSLFVGGGLQCDRDV